MSGRVDHNPLVPVIGTAVAAQGWALARGHGPRSKATASFVSVGRL